MKTYDLSHPFTEDMYTGKTAANVPAMEYSRRPLKTLDEHGINLLQISFGNHLGTHVDAPLHLIAGGKSIDEMPVETFFGTGIVLGIPGGSNASIGPEELDAAMPSIRRGDIVLICTGWGDRFGDPDYPTHHPYLSVDGARCLVAKGVRMVGMDVLSVDLPHSLRGSGFRHEALRILLEAGIPAIHNLTNLEPLVGRRATVHALPIKFRGADGAPARVIAQLS